MGQRIVFGTGIPSIITHNNYFGIGGLASSGSSTEDSTEITLYKNYRLVRAEVNFTAATGGARTVTIRKNNADLATLGPSNSSAIERLVYYPTGSISIEDELTLIYTSSTAASSTLSTGITLNTNGDHHFYYYTADYAGVSITTGTKYFQVFGSMVNRSEASANFITRLTGTLRNLQINIISSVGATGTFTSRKNLSAGNLTVGFTAGEVGKIFDVTNSDSLVPGNEFCISGTTSGATITASLIATMFSANFGQEIGSAGNRSFGFTAGNRFLGFFGQLIETATESQRQLSLGYPAKITNLRVRIGTNGRAGDTLFTLRVGGVSKTMTVTVPAGVGNAWFENTVDIEYCTPEDLLSVLVTGGTSGSITLEQIAVTVVDLSPPEFPRATWH